MPNFTMPRFVYPLLSILFIVVATFFTLRIAIFSGLDVHPDEYNHADAICYYESHWWPPPVNAEGVRYSPYGMSRVYNEEIVYYFFGKLAAIVAPAIEPYFAPEPQLPPDEGLNLFLPLIKSPNYCFLASHTYRLLNVLLLIMTLAVLFWAGKGIRWSRNLALIMLATPMAIYMYSYPNSDAWSLSMSGFLLTFALYLHRRAQWRWHDALSLGVLTALMVLSKPTFWLSIPFAYLIIAHRCFEMWQTDRGSLSLLLKSWFPIAFATTFLLILPMMIIYPLSQGDYTAKTVAMLEQRSSVGLRPSSPTGGYMLRQRGFPLSTVTANPYWWRHSYQSFYGYFGYWTRSASDVAFMGAGLLVCVGIGLTYFDVIRRRAAYPSLERLMLVFAPFFALAPLPLSIYNSWAIDFQPQGRYLLCALLPLSLLVGGAVDDEPRWLVIVRWIVWVLLLGLSFYTLWELAMGAASWETR